MQAAIYSAAKELRGTHVAAGDAPKRHLLHRHGSAERPIELHRHALQLRHFAINGKACLRVLHAPGKLT